MLPCGSNAHFVAYFNILGSLKCSLSLQSKFPSGSLYSCKYLNTFYQNIFKPFICYPNINREKEDHTNVIAELPKFQNFSHKRPETTKMWYFWSHLDSKSQDLKNKQTKTWHITHPRGGDNLKKRSNHSTK